MTTTVHAPWYQLNSDGVFNASRNDIYTVFVQLIATRVRNSRFTIASSFREAMQSSLFCHRRRLRPSGGIRHTPSVTSWRDEAVTQRLQLKDVRTNAVAVCFSVSFYSSATVEMPSLALRRLFGIGVVSACAWSEVTVCDDAICETDVASRLRRGSASLATDDDGSPLSCRWCERLPLHLAACEDERSGCTEHVRRRL